MKLTLGLGLAFFGYLLVYAAVADGGKFAYSPWEGTRSIAYETRAPAGDGGDTA